MEDTILADDEFIVPLPKPVDDKMASDIEKESVFVSPFLEKIVVADDRATARLILRSTDQVEDVKAKVGRYLAAMTKQIGGFDIKVFVETVRRDPEPYVQRVHDKLVERGWLHDYGKGQVAYSGPVLKLARVIDRTAAALYANAFGPRDSHFPAMVDADLLHKCGYLDSHPNAVTFVGNMVEDFDAIEEFRQANSCSDGALLPPHDHLHHGGICLNPAACFPCYPTLSGTRNTGTTYSWLGRVFRYESRNISGLDRLFEFNVRELVFVGDEDYTRDCRTKALPIIEQLANQLDLDCKVQTATDPFFATVSAAKKFWQKAQEVKNEILIPVLKPDGSTKQLACGSVNLHGNFFGNRFDIADGANEPGAYRVHRPGDRAVGPGGLYPTWI